ncbi:MAG: HAMP domain-containing sensor histidine kinase [Alloacidobacterium sp.]
MLIAAKFQRRRRSVQPALSGKYARSKTAAGAQHNEPLAAIAHDARNVVAALRLYCDLLAEPGVLSEGKQHFAEELQAVASASSGLVEQLTGLHVTSRAGWEVIDARRAAKPAARSPHIDDLAAAVEQLKGPLAALAGAKIGLEMECLTCFGGVRLSQQALTRILINLTRNAVEAMQQGGRIRVTVQQGDGGSFFDSTRPPRTVLLCVQDSGPGIPRDQIEHLFDAGFTTKTAASPNRRGLGLNIVRRLSEAAGGKVRAMAAPGGGARFEVELPLIHRAPANSSFVADFSGKANLEC